MHDFDVWRSRPMDVHTWSDYPEINAAVDQVFNSLTEDQQNIIEGTSRNKGKSSGRKHLKVLLLDLYVAWRTDPDLCLGVSRGNGSYSVNSRYNGLHISSRIRIFIDVLADAKFLDTAGGSFHRDGTGGRNRTSRIKATPKLLDVFCQLSFEPYEFDLHHKQECIIRTADKTNEDYKSVKRQEEYEDTAETHRMRAHLEEYNAFLAETYIDLPQLVDPFITRKKKDGSLQHIPVGQNSKFVRRIFSRSSWCLNGRFYGGWWQQIDKGLRKDIVINNVPTVEVDYKGLHVALLSAKRGIGPKPGDRYALKQHLLPKFTAEEQRNILKLLVLTAINAKDEKSAYKAFRQDQPNRSREKRLKDNELSQLLSAFIDENPHLSGDLCSDKGIELMFLDSQITEGILTRFMNARKPVLPVHDSYIVETFDVDLLNTVMAKVSRELTGFDLSLEQSTLGYNDVLRMSKYDRDRYLDTYSEVLSIKDKTPQYEERLLRFMKYRSENYNNTYWIGP